MKIIKRLLLLTIILPWGFSKASYDIFTTSSLVAVAAASLYALHAQKMIYFYLLSDLPAKIPFALPIEKIIYLAEYLHGVADCESLYQFAAYIKNEPELLSFWQAVQETYSNDVVAQKNALLLLALRYCIKGKI